jgi:hypothetical protein
MIMQTSGKLPSSWSLQIKPLVRIRAQATMVKHHRGDLSPRMLLRRECLAAPCGSGNLGRLRAPLSNFGRTAQQSTSVLICLGLAHASPFLRAICSIPFVRNSEVAVKVCSPDINENTNNTDGRSQYTDLMPLTFRCVFNAPRKFSQKNQESNYICKLLLLFIFSAWCPGRQSPIPITI